MRTKTVVSAGAAIPPTVAFSLAAIARRQSLDQNDAGNQDLPQQYLLVHEKPPRGWWLPGGGVEHQDTTPVEAAVRETLEEASRTDPKYSRSQRDQTLLPVMTHLLALQQTPGRIRFIFCGEWLDESTGGGKSVLKLPPGDDDSIEAKWVTLDDVRCLSEGNRKPHSSPITGEWRDRWLRGQEPITFFGILESSRSKGVSIPGLSVSNTLFECTDNKDNNRSIGAFFERKRKPTENSKRTLIYHRGRAALMTHLRARLLIYKEKEEKFAIDDKTLRFPSSHVTNQFQQTLRQLVDEMISDVLPEGSTRDSNRTGTLRMEYTIHSNGTEATLTVFSYVIISPKDSVTLSRDTIKWKMKWVTIHELLDSVEKDLAKAVAKKGGNLMHRQKSGP
eukprot:CCRYP_007036-RA/>CCRYP_007036-RA protein AED:0.43 eAED:1.00 QI:0/0/0/0.5/1/1/2/0/390